MLSRMGPPTLLQLGPGGRDLRDVYVRVEVDVGDSAELKELGSDVSLGLNPLTRHGGVAAAVVVVSFIETNKRQQDEDFEARRGKARKTSKKQTSNKCKSQGGLEMSCLHLHPNRLSHNIRTQRPRTQLLS